MMCAIRQHRVANQEAIRHPECAIVRGPKAGRIEKPDTITRTRG